jgi:hypothetical protein
MAVRVQPGALLLCAVAALTHRAVDRLQLALRRQAAAARVAK